MRKRVLFICIRNSARSQMAEAWLNYLAGDIIEAHSAGLEPGVLNPLAVEAMREVGIDISQKKPQAIFDVFRSGKAFSYVVRICQENSDGRGPIFPGVATRIDWDFPDPAKLIGTHEEKMRQIREIRDAIRAQIENLCLELCGALAA
jgi:arsenate reductase